MEINGKIYNDITLYKISKKLKVSMEKVGYIIDFINVAETIAKVNGMQYMDIINGMEWSNGLEIIKFMILRNGGPLSPEEILEKLSYTNGEE